MTSGGRRVRPSSGVRWRRAGIRVYAELDVTAYCRRGCIDSDVW